MDLLAWVWPVPVLVLAVWLILRVRRDVQGRSRWLLYPVVGVLALLAVGGAVETVIEATDGGRSADGGELVDVGGHKLFIACSGTGSPTVVLEGGLGQGSDYFALIAPAVATTTRVCAYDRAGHGRSEPATGPQDGAAIARDLHALLAASGNPVPTSSPATPLAGCTCASSRPRTPTRLPESCCSTRSRRTRRPRSPAASPCRTR